MSAWRFDPWNLGSDVSLNGIKLLIVAESHYCENGVPDSVFERGETQRVIQEHGVGLETSTACSPIFRTMPRLLESEDTKGPDVWRSIYFYNYFQRAMDHPREPPSQDDFDKGVEPFDGVLRAIRPDAVLVVSARLWEGMKNECVAAETCALGRVYDFTASAGLRIPGAHTHHPSTPRGFDVSDWRPRVSDFMTYVRARKASAGG